MIDYIRLPLPDGLKDRIDQVRGDVPRVVFIRRAIDQQIACQLKAGPLPTLEEANAARARGSHQPGPNVENIRSSDQSKRDVKPIPKGAKK